MRIAPAMRRLTHLGVPYLRRRSGWQCVREVVALLSLAVLLAAVQRNERVLAVEVSLRSRVVWISPVALNRSARDLRLEVRASSSCQADIDDTVAGDDNLSVTRARASIEAACSCLEAAAATDYSGSGAPTVVVPLAWWTEARLTAYTAWYRTAFRGRQPNTSAFVPTRRVATRLGALPGLLTSPGRIAVDAGVLILNVFDLAAAFAVQLDTRRACGLLRACTGCYDGSGTVWAPGYAIASATTIERAFLRQTAKRPPSAVWATVAMHALARCADSAPRLDTGWFSYGCLTTATDGMADLVVRPTPIGIRTHAAWHRDGVVAPSGEEDLVTRVARFAALPIIADQAHWAPPRVAVFFDATVAFTPEHVVVMRGPAGRGRTDDALTVGECIFTPSDMVRSAATIAAWLMEQAGRPTKAVTTTPIRQFALLKHSTGVIRGGNYYHAMAEASQALWALGDFAAASVSASGPLVSSGVLLGLHPWGMELFKAIGAAAGGADPTHPAAPSGGTSLETPPPPPPFDTIVMGEPPSQPGVPYPALGAVEAERFLLADGPACMWPGVLSTLLAREVLRARAGLSPPDMRTYWPSPLPITGPRNPGRMTAPALCLAHPLAPVKMGPDAGLRGCPAVLARPPRIVVIRRSRSRRLADEAAMMATLTALGGSPIVTIFDDEGQPLPLTDAWALFGSADVVLGPHGAAMANIMAAQTGAALLEFGHAKPQLYYGFLSRLLGLSWDAWESPGGEYANVTAGGSSGVAGVASAYCAWLASSLSIEACAVL